MLPIGDEANDRIATRVVTISLIVLCVVVFLYEQTLSLPQLAQFLWTWGAAPEQIRQGQALWSLVTSQFLHLSWLHLLGNMLFLWVFGDNIESAMGHVRFLVFYLVCGVVAALTEIWVSPVDATVLVGASGAIAGVMGAYVALFPSGQVRVVSFSGGLRMVPAWLVLGFWLLIQLVLGIGTLGPGHGPDTGGVAFWAHVGGFVAGALLVWLVRDRAAVERQRRARAVADAGRRDAFEARTGIYELGFRPASIAGLLLPILFVVVAGAIGITVIWLRSR